MIGSSWGALGAVALVLMGVILSVSTAVLARLSGDEVSGWLPVWSHRFLESAVSVMPTEHQDRYREEWKAELVAFEERRIAGLRFAWRLRRRARSVTQALIDEAVRPVFESEPAPVARPLDAGAIAEIVRRVVEQTRPNEQPRFEEIVGEMREMLSDIPKDEVAYRITREYVGDISKKRRQARTRRPLPAMRPRPTDDIGFKVRSVSDWGSGEEPDWTALAREREYAMNDIDKGRLYGGVNFSVVGRALRRGRRKSSL